MRQNFFDLNQNDLISNIIAIDEPKFRASQVWEWVYKKGAKDFDKMTNLPQALRAKLANIFNLNRADVSKELISFDETRKWLLKFEDSNEIEAVFIPGEQRGTLCISSQVGCTLNCKFCHTGTQALVRNLTSGEIIAQLMHAKDSLNDWPADKEGRVISNVVMMGMGEPLLNYNNVSTAIKRMLSEDGLNMSKHKITLSTSGIIPYIKECAVDLGVNLAISLHAVNDELRNILVPINKKYPIKDLLEVCKHYANVTRDKRITFEYVMLDGVNDSPEDAYRLVKMIRGIPSKINLIPFNPWPGSPYSCSSDQAIAKFASIVEDSGYQSPVRTPRGQDIMAACGQLKSESIRGMPNLL